jgi:hypothetical protein
MRGLLIALPLVAALALASCTASAGAWQALAAPSATQGIPLALAADPFVPQLFYGGTSTGQVVRMRIESLGEVPGSGIADNVAVSAILPDPTHKGVVYAGTSGGVYGSTDYGETWHTLGSGLPHGDGEDALALGASSGGGPAPLFAGTEQHGVYASHDGGATWTASASGLPAGVSVYGLTEDAATATLFAALVGQGVYASTDGGASWAARSTGLPSGVDAFAILLLPQHASTPDTLFTGTSKGAFASSDGGQTWHAAGLGQTRVITFARDPTAAGTLYAGTSDAGDSSGSVYRSADGGAHWTEVAPGLGHAVAAVVALAGAKNVPVVYAAAGRVLRYPPLGGESTTLGTILVLIFFVALIGFSYYFLRRTRRQMSGLPGFEPRPTGGSGPGSDGGKGGGTGGGVALRGGQRPHGSRVTATGAIIPTRDEIERGRVEDGSGNGHTGGSGGPWRDQPPQRDDDPD